MISRREMLLATGATLLAARHLHGKETETMLTRKIPRTGEELPVIGMGTWQTFDVGPRERAALVDVLKTFHAAGGRIVDSSPMYGQAEEATGDVAAKAGLSGKLFLASKVWTRGKDAGIAEMTRSMKRMGTARLDLMQIHNLLDWQTHLPVLREWKKAGRIRYLGVTHYARGAFAELEQLVSKEQLDFVQLPYNVLDREAEKRLLPAAAASGTAVLVMRPFGEGALFERVKGKPLPAWAAELDATSWAQLFLKFIVGHPAVTAPIPATSKAEHMADNVRGGMGRLPDEKLRAKIALALA